MPSRLSPASSPATRKRPSPQRAGDQPTISGPRANAGCAFVTPEGVAGRPPFHWQPPVGTTLTTTWLPPTALRPGDHLVLDLTVRGPHVGIVRLDFFDVATPAPDARPRQSAGATLWPEYRTYFVVPVDLLDGQHLRLPRHAGMLSTNCPGGGIRPDEIRTVRLHLKASLPGLSLTLHDWSITRRPPRPRAGSAAVIDALGQWTARDWPGKTPNAPTLVSRLRRQLTATTTPRPDAAGPCRVEFDGRRWWFATRTGERFFSVGPDCVNPLAGGPVLPGSEGLFRWLPPRRAHWRDAWRRDPVSGAPSVDFARTNLIRAFGAEWHDAWCRLTAARIEQLGFNTIGNWSDPRFIARTGTRYVWQWPEFPTTAIKLFRDLPDVFAPEYTENAVRCAEVLRERIDDPHLLGYFLTNEPQWAFGTHNLAGKMLETNPGTHSRRRLAAWLAERYGYDIAACTRAWGIPLTSFDDVITQCFPRLMESSVIAANDLLEFSRILVRAYVGIPARAARTVAPDLLNLGMRYAYVSSELVLEGGEYFDVFSINRYDVEPPLADVDRIMAVTHRPVMIGEFHFGALDRGLPSTGLRGVTDQAERGRAYRYFIERCAAHPGIIGAHYFQWADQAVHGRYDGENYQIGLVDVCSQPYPEFCDAIRSTHATLAAVARGDRPPTDQRPVEIPRTTI